MKQQVIEVVENQLSRVPQLPHTVDARCVLCLSLISQDCAVKQIIAIDNTRMYKILCFPAQFTVRVGFGAAWEMSSCTFCFCQHHFQHISVHISQSASKCISQSKQMPAYISGALQRTFFDYSSSGDTRCAGCSKHQFEEVQAHRTFSNYSLTEIATSIAFFHRGSGCTEPSLTTLLQGLLGGVLETPQTRAYHRRSGWFDCTEPS